jgi:hypothetical protein
MAAVEYDPYQGDGVSIPPHLPSVENLGGESKENDPSEPPDPITMPDARDFNVNTRVTSAHGRVTPAMVLSVMFSGGTPSVYAVTYKNVSLDSGNLTLTDNGVGDTSIEWNADVFPVHGVRPVGLTMNEINTVERSSAVPITNGVRVYTRDGSGSGVDTDFSVMVMGQ